MANNGITGDQLQSIMQKSDSYFIIDCRSFLLYNKSHIKDATNIRCNSIMRRRSKGNFAMDNAITNVDRRRDFLSGKYSTVILYDDQGGQISTTGDEPLTARRTINMVMETLRINAPESTDITYLNCGFKSFVKEHPQFCEGCTAQTLSFDCNSKPNHPCSAHTPVYDQGAPVEILPHLYLGSAHHASQKCELEGLGISALLNASSTCPNYFESSFRYKRIPVEDNVHTDISLWFNEAISFINEEKKRGGKVLVHCHAGVSRSATLCLAYLITCLGVSLSDAFRYVKHRRSVISPNFNFMGQLLKLETDTKNTNVKSSVDINNLPVIEEMEWRDENVALQPTQVNMLAPIKSSKLYKRRALSSIAPLTPRNGSDATQPEPKVCQTAPPRPKTVSFFQESTGRACSQQTSFCGNLRRHSRALTLST